MTFFLVKLLISSLIIALASHLAGKQSLLAGFIVALPIVSMLAILFSYWEYRDMEKINQFAISILLAVPLSLLFFVPFLLNKWFKMNFAWTYLSAIGLLAVAFLVHHFIFRAASFR